ncbi:MAG TPA: 4Fe-4S dicluster domain-containing protein [Methanospirillum sp.]|nr:4Fe-4S dicluster domain-containing protein [Methanospirillum sp.]
MKILPIFRTILQYVVHGPVTIRYPFEPAKQTPATRGHLEITIEDCIFCGLCRMHCPSQAIEVSKQDRTWDLDLFRCIICGCCCEYCPKKCLSLAQTYSQPLQKQVTDHYLGPTLVEPGTQQV